MPLVPLLTVMDPEVWFSSKTDGGNESEVSISFTNSRVE